MRFIDELSPATGPISLNATEDTHQENVKEFCTSSIYLDNMFFFLRSVKEKLHTLLDHDFVCSRTVLELLMCAPYDDRNNWTIAASKYRNTIYMCHVQNNAFGVPRFDHEQLKKAIWMKKLRQHCLTSGVNNDGQTKDYQQEKDSGQYYGVFSMTITGIRLLFDAPVLAERSSNLFNYVDLQMRLDTMNRNEWTIFNRTDVLKWWVQSFLVGIQKIYLAYYDSKAIVHRIKPTMIRELYEECKNNWSANVCANFLARFLDAIIKLMANVDSASLVYMFDYDAKNGIISYKVAEDRNQHSFIPDWFSDYVQRNI
ncbi:hypothetical protein ACLKA6_010539 [Drosophila palustris]